MSFCHAAGAALFACLCSAMVASSVHGQTAITESQSRDIIVQGCIDRVIGQDDSLAAVRNHACMSIPLAESIRIYADALLAMDFTGCPDNFRYAFEGHAYAWEQMIPFAERHSSLRGEMHILFDQLEHGQDSAMFKILLDPIWATWRDVEAAMKE